MALDKDARKRMLGPSWRVSFSRARRQRILTSENPFKAKFAKTHRPVLIGQADMWAYYFHKVLSAGQAGAEGAPLAV